MIAKAARTFTLGLAAAFVAGAALAQTAPPAPSARQMELAHRYMSAVHMEQMFDTTMKSVMPAMIASLPKGDAAQQAKQEIITEAATEAARDMMVKMTARMEPLIAETFSEKELQDLVGFYESPTGQALIAKTPVLMSRMAPMMAELMPAMRSEMIGKICAKMECTAAQKAAGNPS